MVFDDQGGQLDENVEVGDQFRGMKRPGHGCIQLARVLQYLECPQYLRKYFFPLHKDLEFAGVLNPLDAPHHLRQNDVCAYR